MSLPQCRHGTRMGTTPLPLLERCDRRSTHVSVFCELGDEQKHHGRDGLERQHRYRQRAE